MVMQKFEKGQRFKVVCLIQSRLKRIQLQILRNNVLCFLSSITEKIRSCPVFIRSMMAVTLLAETLPFIIHPKTVIANDSFLISYI